MKEDKKMMVMEVKISALSKIGAKEIRKEEVMAIRTRFPNKIPVIVQKYSKENHLPQLDKSKFLVPQDITMSQFQTIIRNRMRMSQNQALYLLVNDRSMLSLSLTLGEVYADHAGPNGFLYITYASQEVFGCDMESSAQKSLEVQPSIHPTESSSFKQDIYKYGRYFGQIDDTCTKTNQMSDFS